LTARSLRHLEEVVLHSETDSLGGTKSEAEDVLLQCWCHDFKKALSKTLAELEKIGDAAVDRKDWLLADACFTPISRTLNKVNDLDEGYKCRLLEKIGRFFCSIGDYPEAVAVYNRVPPNHGTGKKLVETIEKASQGLQKVLSELNTSNPSRSNTTVHPDGGASGRVSFEAKDLLPPIHRAVRLGREAVLSMLQICKGSFGSPRESEVISEDILRTRRKYISSKDTFLRTPLLLAVILKDQEIVKAFLSASGEADAKVLVNARNLRGQTILEIAAASGDLEIVKTLIKWGAEVNPQLLVGTSSPLQAAAANGQLQVARYLLDSQAEALQQRQDDKNALQLAEENGHHDIANLLRQWTEPLIFNPFLNQNSTFGFETSFNNMEIDSNPAR
jgi:hypothetical protein